MKRSDVKALREERQEDVEGIDGLSVVVVPSAGTDLVAAIEPGGLSESQKDSICRRVFVNFGGYTEDDGKAIPNSLAARRELIDVSAVFYTVQGAVQSGQLEVMQGEESADSD